MLNEKDHALSQLNRAVAEFEEKANIEAQTTTNLRQSQRVAENEHESRVRELEKRLEDKEDDMERLKKTQDYEISKLHRSHESEMTQIKNDYESLIEK